MNEVLRSLPGPLSGFSDDLSRLLDAPPAFLEMLPTAIYACDVAGRVLWFNRRAAELWGRAPRIRDDSERFCGSYRLYLEGREIRRDETPMAEVLRTGEPVDGAVALIERPDGSQVWAMVHVSPVRDGRGNLVGAINCFHDVSAQRKAEDELRASERLLRDLLEALPAAIYTTDAAGRITFYNQAAVKLSGRRPELGTDEWCVTWRLYWPDGTPLPHDQCPMAVALKEDRPIRGLEAVAERPDGTRIPFIPYPTPLHDASGVLVGAVNMLVDISERKQAETRQKALLDECNHRVKNTLATVQSLASQSIRGVPPNVVQGFQQRLLALSTAHDHLSRAAWESAELSVLGADMLAPFLENADGRVRVEGEPLRLSPKGALALAMLLHELAANAAKFGALSNDVGTVSVRWKTTESDEGPRLLLDWEESDGPEVLPPKRRGLGTRMLERTVGKELRGHAAMAFEPSGLRGRIDVPLQSVMAA